MYDMKSFFDQFDDGSYGNTTHHNRCKRNNQRADHRIFTEHHIKCLQTRLIFFDK